MGVFRCYGVIFDPEISPITILPFPEHEHTVDPCDTTPSACKLGSSSVFELRGNIEGVV